MKLRNLGFLFCFLFLCSCSQKPLQFIPLSQFDKVDTSITKGRFTLKYRNFIVEYYRDNETSLAAIDSFVNLNIDTNYTKYENYIYVFYKSSDVTNVDHLKSDPRDLDRHSQQNDWIYTYTWSRGTFLGRERIEGGRIVGTNADIRIK